MLFCALLLHQVLLAQQMANAEGGRLMRRGMGRNPHSQTGCVLCGRLSELAKDNRLAGKKPFGVWVNKGMSNVLWPQVGFLNFV